MESKPLHNAKNPFPADHNVNIIDIDKVPIDLKEASIIMPSINSLIFPGKISFTQKKIVSLLMFVNCIRENNKIKNGINESIT